VIVVTAAGGGTGTAVVRALRAQGESVRALVGSARPRPELAALGAEVSVADLRDPDAVAPLLRGADALYLIWPNFDPAEATGAPMIVTAARDAGVGRVVYHSVLRPQLRAMPHHVAKSRVEEALDASGVPWRVLQPCAYSANLDAGLAEAARTGVFRSTWGLQQGQSLVDLRDVADAAALLLTAEGLDGGTFEAAGPEALSAPRIAAELGAVLGREIQAVDAVPDEPVPPLGETPQEYAAHCLRRMLDHYRAHGFVGSPRVLEALLRRPPRRFGEHLVETFRTREGERA
jgi:uncharacterized protein YbjT (DUF2867 family)